MARLKRDVFVPNDAAGTRSDTAVLLVGTAREYGISQQEIYMAGTGFFISEELAAIIYDETADEDNPVIEEIIDEVIDETTTKTSGNRAAKKNSKEE